MKNEKGGALYLLIIVIVIAGFALARGAQYMAFETEKNKGELISNDVYSIINSWSRTMDYLCVNGTENTISVSSIQMSKRMSNYSSKFSMKTTLPPNPTLEIDIPLLSEVTQSFLISDAQSRSRKLSISPVVTVNVNNGVVKIKATRGSSAAEAVAFGNITNANAVSTSILLGGANQYGIDGC